MESEQSHNFNERLSQWVANQGFWFQIRYSMAGSGTRGNTMFHFLRLSFRLLLFLAVLAAGISYYLVKRTESANFNSGLRDSVRSSLSASDIELRGFSRIQGQLTIARLASKGGDKTFFTAFEARNIRCKMGYLDGITSFWDPGTISISKLDMELRAGADDPNSARMWSEAFFKQSSKVGLNSFDIAEANLNWGFSERAKGSIVGSALKVQRLEGGLKLSFRGGTFSQNWLNKVEIVNLIVHATPAGLVFEKAEFKRGQGTVDLTGLKLQGGERPQVSGVARIRMLDLGDILPTVLENFIEGSVSGDFKLTGSTNSSDGIGFEGQVTLDGHDMIFLRERLHLLKALSVVDYSRNYHRVDLREGEYHIKTTGGGLTVTNVKLKGDELLTMEGNMLVRLPTAEETKASMQRTTTPGGAPIFPGADDELRDIQASAQDADLTLKRAALAAKAAKEAEDSSADEAPERMALGQLGLGPEMRQLEEQATERLSRTLRYEGSLRITIPPDAFERAPKLAQQFPVDPNINRIPIQVPLDGSLYELTLKQAEDIYQQGRR